MTVLIMPRMSWLRFKYDDGIVCISPCIVLYCIVLGDEHTTWSPPCGPWESPYEQQCDCLVVKGT